MPIESEFKIEIRCPSSLRRLFMIMRTNGEKLRVTDNLMEFSCSDCARLLRKKGRDVFRVLHRYDLAGELIESIIIDRTEDPQSDDN